MLADAIANAPLKRKQTFGEHILLRIFFFFISSGKKAGKASWTNFSTIKTLRSNRRKVIFENRSGVLASMNPFRL